MAWTDTTQAIAAAVGAVATPGAVLIGIRSLRWQQRQATVESERLALRGVKSILVDSSVREWPDVTGDHTYETLVASVVNSGTEAVFDLTLRWRFGSTNYEESTEKGLLSPGEKWEWPAPMSVVHLGPSEEVSVFATFFDADSVGWAKTQRGDFVRLRDAIFEGW